MNEDEIPKWDGRAKVLPDNDSLVVAHKDQKDTLGERITCPKCGSKYYMHEWCPNCAVYFCRDCGYVWKDTVSMDFDEYQKRCRETDLFPFDRGDTLTPLTEYRTLCLSGEVGELANKVKKIRRDGLSENLRDGIIHELGDVMWYLAILCDLIGVDMKTVAKRNVTMLAKRMQEGKLRGSGDDR